ncbi:MAG: 2-succinyl-5-enolpyruvyl-6-hydroxy-3-cyclohexene-1-carboxylic-acid synthase, partial [Caldithrix sp.]|nr:2-succinyl-5-enolpyruvyl-6-hydroxy-3-cyclohexene-1-carboxylic-acid synthase [Caldithrix sp.]
MKASGTANRNAMWSALIVEELARNGIHYFCISPGSRSTPLTSTVARHIKAQSIIFYDERSAAYHAVGYARACGKPAVLICTSGTAAANYYPAVFEAFNDHIPLIILTADRPPELRFTGSNQTIDQVKMYQDRIKWFFDMPAPTEAIAPEMVLTTIDQLVFQASQQPAGPVHLNCMFREPLAFDKDSASIDNVSTLKTWAAQSKPYTRYSFPETTIAESEVQELSAMLNRTPSGIVLLGRLRPNEQTTELQSFLARLNWPVFPDITSGYRLGHSHYPYIALFDLLLAATQWKTQTILHIGGQLNSKRLQQYLEKNAFENYVVINEYDYRYDPGHRVTWKVTGTLANLLPRLSEKIKVSDSTPATEWSALSQSVRQHIKRTINQSSSVSEMAVARIVSQHIPAEHGLYLASSLPVRQMLWFADAHGSHVQVGANRGTSGIDGTLGAATGFARGLYRPVTVVIGDLAFMHDLNALRVLQQLDLPLTLVLINNGGGGIFHFLPVVRQDDIFEPYFATGHDLTFEASATQFGIHYRFCRTNEEFSRDYFQAVGQNHSTIIEVAIDRQRTQEMYQDVIDGIKASMKHKED